MTARKWQTFVEIDVSICGNIYGVAPCTAAVPTTGAQKCFNTVGSCQDRANYTETFVTLRFAMDTGYQAEAEIDYLAASLVDVNLTPGVISLGENLGQRPSVTCIFRDHPHSDTGPGFDPYLSTRTYNPFEQGTFWGKFAARHPNLRGKKLRVIQGTIGQSLAEMETRHYIIDSVDGPGLDGSFTVTAKDPLKSLDGDRAQAPMVSTGVLNAGINTAVTAATLSPAGVGNLEYPASGFLNFGGTEIVSFTRAADALTIVRAQKGTVAAAHSAGDRVQLCLNYAAADPADIVDDLLTTYGGIDASYIPLTDWQAETAAYNGQVYTAFIPEPTPVKTLVAELIEQAGLAIWWDEVTEQLRLQVLRAIATDAQLFDETTILKGSLRITAQPDKRKSQIWTYFAQKNPIDGIDLDNLPGVAVLEDTDAEADFGSPLVKVIRSRWIPTGGRLIAERVDQLQLGRYWSPPRRIEFDVVADGTTSLPVAGGGYQLSAPPVQDGDGSRITLPFQVTSIKLKDGRCSVVGEELYWTDLAPDPLNRIIAIDYNVQNVNWRTLHDALFGDPTAGGTVTMQIASNARVGSTSTSTPALQTGTWPTVAFTATRSTLSKTLTSIADTSAFVAGQAVTGTGLPNDARVVSKTSNSVTLDVFPTSNGTGALTLWTTILKLVNDGQIIGAGAAGGVGKGGDNNTGGTGGAGGTGLKATAPAELSGAGKVDGGGGGGGGGGGDFRGWVGPQQNGGGGGGGAGDTAGNGGGYPGGGSGAAPGQPGTLEDGGAGGHSNYSNYRGGHGGDPGQAGEHAVGDFGGAAGAAGKSVDGASLIKDAAFTGAYRGSQIN
jgi:hypothetical protein